MKYKIGDVSKILNIPADTLRYYEKMNIVHPDKNYDNQYRSYMPWDINFLTECKRFRGFDFSLSEIEEIMHHDNLDHFTEKFVERQQYFEDKLKYYSLLVQKNKNIVADLKNAKNEIGQYTFSQHPDMYYFLHRFNYQYVKKDTFGGIFESWTNYFPFIDFIVEMKMDDVIDRNNNNNYSWGFSIEKEYANAFNIPFNNKVRHIEEMQCVSTIICAGSQGSFSLKLLDDALEFIEKNGYELSGNVTGIIIARVHEPEGYHRYFKIWLPVKQ
jgi:DNA-binding transcriptional MerR regulator